MRHAQASPAAHDSADAARVLTERGRRDAAALGALLRDAGTAPPVDRILCSGAARTRETLVRALGGPARAASAGVATTAVTEHDDALYLASADALTARIDAALADGARHVLLVGHNPGLERLCARLTGITGFVMDTCTCCVLRLEGDRVEGGRAALIGHDVPRG